MATAVYPWEAYPTAFDAQGTRDHYEAWLRLRERKEVTLVAIRVEFWDGATTTVQWLRAGTRSMRFTDPDDGQFPAALKSDVVVAEEALSGAEAEFTADGFSAVGNIVLDNSTGRFDSFAAGTPTQVAIFHGAAEWPELYLFEDSWYGAERWDLSNPDELGIVLRDFPALLDTPVLQNKFTSGPSDGQWKPLAIGEMELFSAPDTGTNTYLVNDGDTWLPGSKDVTCYRFPSDGGAPSTGLATPSSGAITLPVGLQNLTDYDSPLFSGVSDDDCTDLIESLRYLCQDIGGVYLDFWDGYVEDLGIENFFANIRVDGDDPNSGAGYTKFFFGMLPCVYVDEQQSIREVIFRLLAPLRMWVTSTPSAGSWTTTFTSVRLGGLRRPRAVPVTVTGGASTCNIEYFGHNMTALPADTHVRLYGATGADASFYNDVHAITYVDADNFTIPTGASRGNPGGRVMAILAPSEARAELLDPDVTKVIRNPDELWVEAQRPYDKLSLVPARGRRTYLWEDSAEFALTSNEPNAYTKRIENYHPIRAEGTTKEHLLYLGIGGLSFYHITCEAQREPLAWYLGDLFHLYDDRFGLSQGKQLQITSIVKNFTKGTIEIVGFG